MNLRPETLTRYVELARPILIERARLRTNVTYVELQGLMGGPGLEHMGELVGQISLNEIGSGRPKLSAVVINSTGNVGGGFFGLPKTPANVRRVTAEEQQNQTLTDEEEHYWRQELERVCAYPWAT